MGVTKILRFGSNSYAKLLNSEILCHCAIVPLCHFAIVSPCRFIVDSGDSSSKLLTASHLTSPISECHPQSEALYADPPLAPRPLDLRPQLSPKHDHPRPSPPQEHLLCNLPGTIHRQRRQHHLLLPPPRVHIPPPNRPRQIPSIHRRRRPLLPPPNPPCSRISCPLLLQLHSRPRNKGNSSRRAPTLTVKSNKWYCGDYPDVVKFFV